MERQDTQAVRCVIDKQETYSHVRVFNFKDARQERNIHVWHGMKREVVRCVIEGQETHRHMCHREKKYSQTFVL